MQSGLTILDLWSDQVGNQKWESGLHLLHSNSSLVVRISVNQIRLSKIKTIFSRLQMEISLKKFVHAFCLWWIVSISCCVVALSLIILGRICLNFFASKLIPSQNIEQDLIEDVMSVVKCINCKKGAKYKVDIEEVEPERNSNEIIIPIQEDESESRPVSTISTNSVKRIIVKPWIPD